MCAAASVLGARRRGEVVGGMYNARVPVSWVKPGPFFLEARRRVPPPPIIPPTLLDWLAARYPAAKRQTLRRMVQAGRVTVNGAAARNAKQAVGGGDVVVVSDAPPP